MKTILQIIFWSWEIMHLVSFLLLMRAGFTNNMLETIVTGKTANYYISHAFSSLAIGALSFVVFYFLGGFN